jgi:peptide/nickel transport system permease protein
MIGRSVIAQIPQVPEDQRLEAPQVKRRKPVLAWISITWVVFILGVAALADVLPFAEYGTPIGTPRTGLSGSFDELFGLDSIGRSVISRLAYGGRASLLIAVVAAGLAMVIGTSLGLVAGYYRGRVESVIMYFTDAFLAFPPIVLLLAISASLQPSYRTLIIGLTIVELPAFIRLARANTLAWSARGFVQAATNLGAKRFRIATREVLPNVVPSVLAYFPTIVAVLIIAEGSLSFLGLGIPSPTPSWGGLIADGKDYLEIAPHLVIVPAVTIFLTVFSLNQIGQYVRDKFDLGGGR